jgi:polysaccharide biosynthesis/export protein
MTLTRLSILAFCMIACYGSATAAAQEASAEATAKTVASTTATTVASITATTVTSSQQTPDLEVPSSADYVLQPGDVLNVSVWKETDLTAEVLIQPDGGMSFALAGELHAAGHTVSELTTMLEKRIRKFEPDAVVTVSIKLASGNRVYVIGKVNHPGDFPLNRPTDVMQALSLAGGATPFAETNAIRILRRDGGRQTAIAFRYGDVEHGRRLQQNILLQSGDTVVVP